jgi:hypothetical protein
VKVKSEIELLDCRLKGLAAAYPKAKQANDGLRKLGLAANKAKQAMLRTISAMNNLKIRNSTKL